MKTAFIAFYFFLLAYISFYGVHLYWLIIIYLRNRSRILKPADGPLGINHYPMVTIQLPLFNEKRVAVRLIKAVTSFDWPADRLEIQVLDDSTDITSRHIAGYLKRLSRATARSGQHLPAIHHLRRTRREGFKAGALAEGLQRARGDFVAVFDADNLPQPDFLKANIPFFN
ncbi:MAG: glycosyltransferase, partial [Candidatus Zixiibacteriota bacterium]